MKILSYNIMSGGFSDYGDMSKKPQRLDLLRKIITEQKPDFVSLIDTYRWTEVFNIDELQKIFGYKNIFMVKLDDERLIKKGHDNGITVMTNLDVLNFIQIRLFNRNAIKTTVNFKDKKIDIFSIYLDDMSEDTRLKQVESLFGFIDKTPTIFMGDLNTIDGDDKTILPILGNSLDGVFREMSRGEVIKFIRNNDFMDTNLERTKTVPTKLFPIKISEPIARLDYIFYRGDFKVKSFDVLRGDLFDKMSDHFPVRVSLETDDMFNAL